MLTRRLRVVVADDHTYVRSLVRQLLELEPDIQVVAEAGTAAEMLACVARHQPDALVIDWSLPGGAGLETLHELRKRWPSTAIVTMPGDRADSYGHAARERLMPDMLANRVRRAVGPTTLAS